VVVVHIRTELEKSGKREGCRSEQSYRRAGRGRGADQNRAIEEQEEGGVQIRTEL
jgi:hypothetical protein